MKTWKKVLWGVLAVLGILIAAGGGYVAWRWDEMKVLAGTQGLEGEVAAVPAVGERELSPLTVGEADWLCWRGVEGEGRSLVRGIRTDWTGRLAKLWEVNFLCQGGDSTTWSSPVVRGNRLVVCGRDDENDLIFCLDAADGSLIWRVSYASETANLHGTGPRATPYIEEDRVYTFGRGGELGCWNLLDGAEIWRRNVENDGGAAPSWGHSSSPLVVGDKVMVQGGGTARTMAYNKMSGEVVWKSGEGLAGYAAMVTTELEGKPALLVFHGVGLAALEAANGEELWDIGWATPYDVNAGTPIVLGDEVFITSGYNVGGALLKMGAGKAEVVWKNKVIASQHSDPYIIDGYLYGYSGQSNQNRGAFKCVEVSSGKEQWATNAMGWGTCLWVEGYLLCCDIKGNIFLMKPGPEKFELVTKMSEALGKVSGPVWTIPVAANGRLYLRFKQKMVGYELGKREEGLGIRE